MEKSWENGFAGEYHLEMEMCAAEYVTAITTVMDTEEGLRRLRNALLKLDEKPGKMAENQPYVMNEQKNGDCAETVEALKNDHGRGL